MLPSLELSLVRREFGDTYTGGQFQVEGMIFGDSLEPKSRHLSKDMPLSEIKARKVYGKTAIPTGRYKLELRVSPSLKDRPYAKAYGGKFPYLVGVPGWKDTMIHPFNLASQSKGCIGIGEKFQPGNIIKAAEGYTTLMDIYLMPAFNRNQEVYLTITEEIK